MSICEYLSLLAMTPIEECGWWDYIITVTDIRHGHAPGSWHGQGEGDDDGVAGREAGVGKFWI